MDFVDLVSGTEGLQWLIARVKTLNYNAGTSTPPTVDLIIGATGDSTSSTVEIKNAAVLQSYSTPNVDDVVHVLFHPNVGSVVLGPAQTLNHPVTNYIKLSHGVKSIPHDAVTIFDNWSVVRAFPQNSVGLDGVTITKEGVYAINGLISWSSASNTGVRRISIQAGGSEVSYDTEAVAFGFTTHIDAQATEYLEVGDTIEVGAYQSSGGALNANEAILTVTKIG